MVAKGVDSGAVDRKYVQVAAQIKAAIDEGVYQPGAKLPSQTVLAEMYRASRPTIQLALQNLERIGILLPLQQGRRAEVAKGTSRAAYPVGHGAVLNDPVPAQDREFLSVLESAFDEPEVHIDFCGYTSETLYSFLRPLFRRMIAGERDQPERIRLRLLIPGDRVKLAVPRAIGDADDPRPRDRLRETRRTMLSAMLQEMADLQHAHVGTEVEVRQVDFTPTFKLYVINDRDVFTGLYQLRVWDMPLKDGERVDTIDVRGHGVRLQRIAAHRAEVFGEYRDWFDAMWQRLSEPYDEQGPG